MENSMSQYMVVDPLALGAEYKLGNYKVTYQPHRLTRKESLFLIAIMVGISLFLLIPWYFSPGNPGIIIYSILTLVLLGVISIIARCWDDARKKAQRVFIYDDGLVHLGYHSVRTIIYWRNVQSIYHKENIVGGEYGTATVHTYILNCTDGTSLKLNSRTFSELDEPTPLVVEEITRYLFPASLNTYQMGQAIGFGPLTVTQRGVRYKKRFIPWSEVKGVSDTGYIRFQKPKKSLIWRINVNRAKVPNIGVLKMLIEHILSSSPSSL